jgi:hypothetical protein
MQDRADAAATKPAAPPRGSVYVPGSIFSGQGIEGVDDVGTSNYFAV